MKKKNAALLIVAAVIFSTLNPLGFAHAAAADIPADAFIVDNPGGDVSPTDAESNLGYHDIGVTIPSYKESNMQAPAVRAALPASYRNVAYITPVKNQGSYGTCWSFAPINAMEAGLIRSGAATTAVDMSELHLAYFFYNPQTDPLGGTAGDKNVALGSNFLSRGGNTYFTTPHLASWQGAAAESLAPYSSAASVLANGLPGSYAYNDLAHLQNAQYINMSDADIVKTLLMQYGTAVVSYYDSSTYRSADGRSYFNNSVTSTNHAVSIVGWDDNYSRTNFRPGTQPVNNGAWIIKNSWGTSSGASGYFWISYEDVSIKGQPAYFYDVEPATNYDNNYQYDGAAGRQTMSYTGSSAVYMGNVFTANSNETLKAVSFYTWNLNLNYEIQVYKNVSTTPSSGTPVYSQVVSGNMPYIGYHTVKLPQAVQLSANEKYSVVIKLIGTQPSVACDSSYTNGNWIQFISATAPGQSYMGTNGTSWYDLNGSNACARIKAFTDER